MITTYNYNLHPFSLAFNKISRQPGSFRDEAIKTAKYISSCADKPLIVALSGGIDSEVICRSFIDAGINFEALTLVHKYNDTVLNLYDVKHATEICKVANIKHTLVDLENKEFRRYISKFIKEGYCSRNIFRYLQLILLDIIERKNACGILGSGEQVYSSNNDKLVLSYDASIANSLEWIKKHNTLHFPYFFQTTPEIMSSYLEHELVKFLTKTDNYHKSGRGWSLEKILVYHSEWHDLIARDKRSGLEFGKLRQFMDTALIKLLPPEETYKIPVDELRTQLGIKDC